MTDSLAILFSYYRNDDLTRHHLDLLQQHNPDLLIIPVTCDADTPLPGTVDVRNFDCPWPRDRVLASPRNWHQCDTVLYRWFMRRNVTADRYIYLEYDCRCTIALAQLYAPVWDAQVACRQFHTPQSKPDWHWFQMHERVWMDEQDRPFAGGVTPFAGTLFSHDALARIVEVAPRSEIFCELRLGTAVRKANLNVQPLPGSLQHTLNWKPTTSDMSQPGLYHPVKHIL